MSESFIGEWDGQQALPSLFHEVPKAVYRSSPHWIPEVPSMAEYMFSSANQYFTSGSVWLAVDEEMRMAGFFSDYQNIDGKKAAYFGYWETSNNLSLNRKRFDAFEAWAKSKGAELIYGPINFSTYGLYRIRVDSFQEHQFIGEPYNPEYYPELLDNLGYKVCKEYATSDVKNFKAHEKEHLKVIDSLEDKLKDTFTFKSITPQYWLDNIESLYHLSLEVFKNNFAYTPITLEDFKKVCGESFANKICRHTSLVAETHEGDIAGMMLTFPDYSQLVNQSSDLEVLPDSISFDEHFDLLKEPAFLIKTAGISDRFRGNHLYTYVFTKAILNAKPYYKDLLGCLYISDNLSRNALDRMTDKLRHYALYNKEI